MTSFSLAQKGICLILSLLAFASCTRSGNQAQTGTPADNATEDTQTANALVNQANSEKNNARINLGQFEQSELIDISRFPVLSIRPFGEEYDIKPTEDKAPLIRVDAYIDTELVIENVSSADWSLELTLTSPSGQIWHENYHFASQGNDIKNADGQLVGSKNELVPGDLYNINLNFNSSLEHGIWLFEAMFRNPKLGPLTTKYNHQNKRVCIQAQAESNPLNPNPSDVFTAGSKIYIFGADAPPEQDLIMAFYRYAEEGEVQDNSLLNPQVVECATKISTDQDGRYRTVFTIGPEIKKGSYIIAKGTALDNLELAYFSGQFEIK